MKLYPTMYQSKILDEFIDTHRYVYNRTLEYIKKNGHEPLFEPLRDLLATEKTRKNYSCNKYYNKYLEAIKVSNNSKEFIKNEINDIRNIIKKLPLVKNPLVNDFELRTSNEIRSNAIKSVCDSYKTGFANLKANNIKYFDMSFKKKNQSKKCIELASSDLSFCNTGIKICPSKFNKDEQIIKISKNNQLKYKNLNINKNSDLIKINGNYFIHITLKCEETKELRKLDDLRVCGVDPGIRDFISIYGTHELTSISIKKDLLNSLNNKIRQLKTARIKPLNINLRNKYRKKQINKVEKKKIDIANELHWNVINYLLKTQDVIFFGDIKSHNIVKKSYKTLNRSFNDLKFYKFKQRLLYKCILNNKKVFFINEAYTSQGCSTCGNLWRDIKDSKVYTCKNVLCKTKEKTFDRDFNAAKNMLLKGLLC